MITEHIRRTCATQGTQRVACIASWLLVSAHPAIVSGGPIDCIPAANDENFHRLSKANNYAVLTVSFPGHQSREIVLYSDMAPTILAAVGVLKGRVRPYPAPLTDTEARSLASKPIVFDRALGSVTDDSPRAEQCRYGGVVERTSDDSVWGPTTGLDDILEEFFTPIVVEGREVQRYALRSEILPKLTCAAIADLLRCNVSLHRSPSGGTLILRKKVPGESTQSLE